MRSHAVLFYALPYGGYTSAYDALRDLVPTMTFTQTFFPAALIGSKINGVLWTVAVEMQFYLFFPLLARAFQRKPVLTYLAMVGAGTLYLRGFALSHPDTLRLTLNQLPAFLGVFANGMLGAYAFVALAKHQQRDSALSISATVVFFACLYLISLFFKGAASTQPVQMFQANYRFVLSLVFLATVLSAALSARWLRFLLGNRVMAFLAAISFNIYIWHQWIALRFKDWHFPYWEGDTLPNMVPDRIWQGRYTFLVFAAAIALAALITYCFEKPVGKAILNIGKQEKGEHDGTSIQDAGCLREQDRI